MLAAAAVSASMILPTTPTLASAPSGNQGIWHQTLREDFTSLNTARWGTYTGFPGDHGVWKPSHVVATRGVCQIRGYREGASFVTGGMMLQGQTRTYGKYLARARFARGDGIGVAMLLWPKTGWPPEIDFAEAEANEGRIMAVSHWSATNQRQLAFVGVDMRQWHTYGVEWAPNVVRYTLDGRVWATMTGPAVPHQPMNLVFQTGANKRIGPISASQPARVDLELDWVSVYKYGA